jgi:hypothetical protein
MRRSVQGSARTKGVWMLENEEFRLKVSLNDTF